MRRAAVARALAVLSLLLLGCGGVVVVSAGRKDDVHEAVAPPPPATAQQQQQQRQQQQTQPTSGGAVTTMGDDDESSVCDGDHFCELLGYTVVAGVVAAVGWCFYRACAGDPATLLERFELRTAEYKQVTEAAKSLPGNAEWITSPPDDHTVLHAFPRPGVHEWHGWYQATESNANSAQRQQQQQQPVRKGDGKEDDGVQQAAAAAAARDDGAAPNTMQPVVGERLNVRVLLNFNAAPAPVINSNGNVTTRPATVTGSGTEPPRTTDVSTGAVRIAGKFAVDGLWSGATGRVAFTKVHGKGERQVSYFFRGRWDGRCLKGDWHLIHVAANLLERGHFELYAPDSALHLVQNAPKLVYSAHATHLAANADPWQVAPLQRTASARAPVVGRHHHPHPAAAVQMQMYPQLHTYQAGGIPPGAVHAIAIPMPVHRPSSPQPPAAVTASGAGGGGSLGAGGGASAAAAAAAPAAAASVAVVAVVAPAPTDRTPLLSSPAGGRSGGGSGKLKTEHY